MNFILNTIFSTLTFNLTTIKPQDKEQNSDILVCLLLEKNQKRLPASERKPFLIFNGYIT